MRNSLPISHKELRQENLRELFQILEEVFAESDISYYVLGALARDAWYSTESNDHDAITGMITNRENLIKEAKLADIQKPQQQDMFNVV